MREKEINLKNDFTILKKEKESQQRELKKHIAKLNAKMSQANKSNSQRINQLEDHIFFLED